MMRSLYTGVSGLSNHQTRMDVLSNNIANVNTIGYKGSRTVFADTLSQTMQGASGPSANLGGTNAKQIGLGMKVSAIDIMFTPTSFQTTNKVTDLAINNNGFFIVRDGAQQFYTRAGNFDFDKEGNMVQTGSGLKVVGWQADANGNINTATPIAPIVIPTAASMPAKPSTTIVNTGQIQADLPMGGAVVNSDKVYDSLGNAHVGTSTYTKIANNTWLVYTSVTDAVTGSVTGNVKQVTFDNNGVFSSVEDVTAAGSLVAGGPPYVITGVFGGAYPNNALNLNSQGKTTDTPVTSAINFVDQNGVTRAIGVKATCTTSYDGTKDAVWKVEFLENGKAVGSTTYNSVGSFALPTITLTDGSTYSFDAASVVDIRAGGNGALANNGNGVSTWPPTPLGTNNPLVFQPLGGAALVSVNQTYDTLRQYSGDSTLLVDADGYAAGVLNDKSVDDKGVIIGLFSNGERLALGQLATAIFVNQAGLERAGNTTFRESNNSGTPQIGTAGTGGRGTMQAGVLEMANVDLAEEFTNMIVTQRGFQANSRTITTSDEMLQELMSLKR